MKLFLCSTLLLVMALDKGCQQQVAVDQKNSQVTYSTTITNTQTPAATPEQLGRQTYTSSPCQPIVLYIYDDGSSSVDDANSRIAKEQVIAGLRQHPDACIKLVKLTRFGVASVWTTPARQFVFPLHPYCPPEPDYNQLPAGVRNLEVWREDLRRKNQLQCTAGTDQFQKDYDAAITTFAAALLTPPQVTQGQKNTCTSFGNMFERARRDLQGDDSGRIMILSDLIWDCREKKPQPFYAKGVIVQIVDGGTDDRIRTSPDELTTVFKRILPNVVPVQEVNADRAVQVLVPTLNAGSERAMNNGGN